MLTFVLLSLLAGMVLAQRFKVLVLAPAIAVTVLAATGLGLARHDGLGSMLILAGVAIASLQIGYLAGIAVRYSLVAARASGLRIGAHRGALLARRGAR